MQRRARTADLAFFAVLAALIALPFVAPLTQASTGSGTSSSGSSNSGGGGTTTGTGGGGDGSLSGSSDGSSNSGGNGDATGSSGGTTTGGTSNGGSSSDDGGDTTGSTGDGTTTTTGGSSNGGGSNDSSDTTGNGTTTTGGSSNGGSSDDGGSTGGGTTTTGSTGGGTDDSNGFSGGSSDDNGAPLTRPTNPGTPQGLVELVPAIGTVTEVTARNLPPFLFLGCLTGLIAGADSFPGPVFYPAGADAPTAVGQLCSRIDVRPLTDGFGGSGLSSNASSNVSTRDVDPDQVQIRIEVMQDGRIVVQQELREVKQRVAFSLVAALLIVLGAIGVGFVIGRGRSRG